MKAQFIAAAMSLVITLPLHANINNKAAPANQVASASSRIDLNKADVSTLTGSFKGIGRKRAEAIVAYREAHHGFKSIEELAEIKGFGQRFMNTNREKLSEVFLVN